jgi:phosphoenolpyruvate carboxykinase (ATP)
MLNAALDGNLDDVEFITDPRFNIEVPTSCPGVPSEVLQPRKTWQDVAAFDVTADKLARMVQANFTRYESGVSDAVNLAGPSPLV